ncbi:glutamate--cysteine ligase [Candidatus Uabimicrobium sp. HlEnr_7]|uniref:glutamate--cysteine ligase n=1 Tax=Candidatus Uabimicrobium helgolandensis TaxID=3095367 RepID=UPI0035589CFB
MLLNKGFEVEMYTGTYEAEIIGLSDKISRDLEGFEREPDTRNVEYITSPTRDYKESLCKLIQPRVMLREYLKSRNYTIIPGSALSLGDTKHFDRSYPDNPYHDFIEQTYGTNVVTASIHINLGIGDPEVLMRVCRVIRMEGCMYLAMSASSPFMDNEVTGYHSTRWKRFPKTPKIVPLFSNHRHYIDWMEEQIRLKNMQNVRHLWSSVRPNGNKRPYELNRLELRICDLVSDPMEIVTLTALLEARVIQIMNDETIDPLTKDFSNEELRIIADDNDEKAAEKSLEAQVMNWETGQTVTMKSWIEDIYSQTKDIAKKHNFGCCIDKIPRMLDQGSMSQQWLKLFNDGHSIQNILKSAIQSNILREKEIFAEVCSNKKN